MAQMHSMGTETIACQPAVEARDGQKLRSKARMRRRGGDDDDDNEEECKDEEDKQSSYEPLART